jgi:hypothetical protein
MKLLSSYSRSCSVDIKHKPFLYEKYFPLAGINKYITIQTKSGMPAKDFSNFQEVIDILRPILDKENIKVIHLGQDSPPLNNVINLNNQTSIGQAFYLLKRSLCHLSVDSWMAHAACAENVPCVALYGSTTVVNHAPYHFDPTKSIFLESHRNGQKASFQREESNKTVDLILPEDIASSVCKLLNIPFNYEFSTLSIGKLYHNKIIETCLDSVINLAVLNIPSIVCRCDYVENLNLGILVEQMKVGKVSILTNRPIPINLLQQFKSQIQEVIYEITPAHNPLFCKELIDAKIPFRMYSRLSDYQLNPIKLDYLDFQPVITKVSEDLPDKIKNQDKNNLYLRGGKFILSKSGIYNCYANYKMNKPITNFDAPPQKFEGNLEDLKRDVDYLLFVEKVIDKTNDTV